MLNNISRILVSQNLIDRVHSCCIESPAEAVDSFPAEVKYSFPAEVKYDQRGVPNNEVGMWIRN